MYPVLDLIPDKIFITVEDKEVVFSNIVADTNLTKDFFSAASYFNSIGILKCLLDGALEDTIEDGDYMLKVTGAYYKGDRSVGEDDDMRLHIKEIRSATPEETLELGK